MSGARPHRVLLACGLAALAVAAAGTAQGVVGAQPLVSLSKPPVQARHGGVDGGAAAAFRDQSLSWSPCIDPDLDPGLPRAYYRQLCSTLSVPMDWNDPGDGRTLQLAVSKLPASGLRTGVLFTNPGGPGGEGLNLPLMLVGAGRTAITRSQDVYGIDVRGTGSSANATCGGVGQTVLDPRDRDPANLQLMVDVARLTARACDVAGGALIDVIGTAQTVQDLELLRRVIGAQTVNWLGYSAGTWLGAHYATAFPASVGRMVLDSNTDFTADWEQSFGRQPAGFERRFRQDFLRWVARYDSYYGLGATPELVGESFERIRAGLTPGRPVESAVVLDRMIAGAMYARSMFPIAALVLQEIDHALAAEESGRIEAAEAGYARAARLVARLQAVVPTSQVTSVLPASSDASLATFLAVTCNDTVWNADESLLVSHSAAMGAAYPLVGWSTVDEPCAFWQRTGADLPTPTGVGVPPVLMVQAERDPATPLEGAQHAADTFTGARLLTVQEEGDHGLYAGGNACVDAAVEAFLLDGVLPQPGATCRGLPMPSPETYLYTTAQGGVATRGGLPIRGANPLLALRVLDGRLPAAR